MDYRHLALVVDDLRAAETLYRRVFSMEIIGREAWGENGLAYALRPDKGWDEAIAADVDIQFVALRRDDVIVALLKGDASPGQLFAVGLVMDAEEISQVRDRLGPDPVLVDQPEHLEFFDPFGVRWQISTDSDFRHAGDIADRWIDL